MADDDPPFKPGGSLTFGKTRRKTASKPDGTAPELPSWELQEGYRILQELMKASKCFLEAPDAMEKGMGDYFEVIEKPMWFLEMKRKFEEAQYAHLVDFVSDVRLMLLNCYRYFGPHAYHTKRALSVENRLEQKLSLLPVDYQKQCALEATNGPLENVEEGAEVQSRLLHSVRMERFQREKARRQKLAEERKADEEGKDSDVLQWEREVLFQGNAREIMASMWELPVIGHFILLGLEHLNIEEIPQFEIERIFLMPQASRSLSIIMTTLLSPPMMRMKLPNKPPMPYKIWTRKLKLKVALWYKMYAKSNNNADLMFEKLGIEHQFWKILGSINPLEEYEFHELTFHQRVWLVKTLCDYLLQHQRILRDLVAGQPEEFGNCLGMDRLGAKFLYFRQFFGQDVRVYRQAPEPPSWIERDLEYQAEFEATSSLDGTPKTKKVRRKKGRGVVKNKALEGRNSTSSTRKIIKRGWKHGKLKQANKSSSSSNQSSSSKTQINSDCPPVLTNSETGELEQADLNLPPPVLHKENSSPQNSSSNSFNGDKESNVHNEQCGENNKIEEKKICDITNKVDKDNEKCDISDKVEEDTEKINNNVEDKEKLVNNVEDKEKQVNNEDKEKLVNNVEDKDKCHIINTNEENKVDSDKCVNGVDAKQNITDIEKLKADWTEEPIGSVIKIEPQTDATDTTEVEIKAPRKPLYDPHWLRPGPDDFLLVADSVDGIRELLAKYCDDDLDLIQRMNNAKAGRGSRPSCEIRLAKRLNELIIELEPCELKSVTDTKKCRRKLYDEWYTFEIRPEDYVDADETFWLNEKEAVEVTEETPMEETTDSLPLEQEGVVASQGSEGVEEAANETLEIAPEEVADTSLDSTEPTSRQRTLRNRRITVNNFLGLWGDKEEESLGSESDSGNSDLWEMPKKKKKRKPRVPKVIVAEDEETCDGAKPKKQQKKKDKTATEEMTTDDQNSSSTTVPAAGFEGAYSAWLGDSKKENDKGKSKKRTESCDNANSSLATSKAGKHPPSAANVRKKLFNENTNPKTLSTPTSTTVSTTVSNTQSLTKVSSSTSIVLKHMAQNFAEPTNPNLPAQATPRTSTASETTKLSASKTSAAVEEVVILSDDSDDEIQVVGVHNPPPAKTKPPRTRMILQQYPASTLLQKNIPQLASTSRPATLPSGTQFGVVTAYPRIATVESIASSTATVQYTQQARRSTITSTSSQQHSMQSPTALKSSTNAVFSTPPSKGAQPVVVATIGNSSVLLRSPQPSSPATPQRKQRTQPVLRSPMTAVVLPTPATFHSPSQTVAHTPPQVTLRSPPTVTMRSPLQVSIRSPATTVLPVGTEITLRPSPVHSQVQVSSPQQATRFTPPSGRIATSPTVTPANVGNMAQVAGGTRATLVVVPGDGNTASNYALAFSNGTRMILTPEQVAQIRAENNGVLGTGSLSGIFGQ